MHGRTTYLEWWITFWFEQYIILGFITATDDPERLQFLVEFKGLEAWNSVANLNVTCLSVDPSISTVEWSYAIPWESPKSKVVGNTLQIKDIRESKSFKCVGKSNEQYRASREMVDMNLFPLAPVDLKVTNVTDSSLRLTWNYPLSFNTSTYSKPSDIGYYVVQYALQRDRYSFSGTFETPSITENHYTIENLKGSRTYRIRVLAVNHHGRGPVSEPAFGNTIGYGMFVFSHYSMLSFAFWRKSLLCFKNFVPYICIRGRNELSLLWGKSKEAITYVELFLCSPYSENRKIPLKNGIKYRRTTKSNSFVQLQTTLSHQMWRSSTEDDPK